MILMFPTTGGRTILPDSHVIRVTDSLLLTEDTAYYGTLAAPDCFIVSHIDPPLGGCPF
jgi:hypothetical protein